MYLKIVVFSLAHTKMVTYNNQYFDLKGIHMKVKRILIGTIIWALGILVPVLQHIMLMRVAVTEEGYTYSFRNMVKYFFDLPWIVWPYLIAMWLVGTILVISGLRAKTPQQ